MRPALILLDWIRHRVRLRRWTADQAWGRRGEDLAHRFVEKHGLRVVSRNFTAAPLDGELDLVAHEGEKVVFIEVKTRRNDLRAPEDAVDQKKRENLTRTAELYLRLARMDRACARFDIVSVVLDRKPRITHIRDAFSPTASL